MKSWGDDLLHDSDPMRKARQENDVLSAPYAIHNLNGYPEVIGFAATLPLLAAAGRFLRYGRELTQGSAPRDDDHESGSDYIGRVQAQELVALDRDR